jgi:hypothetical protein
LTGYFAPIETGLNPFEGGPALAWCTDGQVTLMLSDVEAGAGRLTGATMLDYLSYTIDEWLKAGSTSVEQVAYEKLLTLLEKNYPVELSAGVDKELRRTLKLTTDWTRKKKIAIGVKK